MSRQDMGLMRILIVFTTGLVCLNLVSAAPLLQRMLGLIENIKGYKRLYNLNVDMKASGLLNSHYDMAMEFLLSCNHEYRHKKEIDPAEFSESLFNRPCRVLKALYKKHKSYFDSLPADAWDPQENQLNRVKFVLKDCDVYTEPTFSGKLYKAYKDQSDN